MKMRKIIGTACLVAFAASVIPYSIKRDDESGTLEVRSLLWGMRKTPGEDRDTYAFAIPSSGLDESDELLSEVSADVED